MRLTPLSNGKISREELDATFCVDYKRRAIVEKRRAAKAAKKAKK